VLVHSAISHLLTKRVSGNLGSFEAQQHHDHVSPLLAEQWSMALKGVEAPSGLLSPLVSKSKTDATAQSADVIPDFTSSNPVAPFHPSTEPVEGGATGSTETNRVPTFSETLAARPDELFAVSSTSRPALLPLLSSEAGGRPASLLRQGTPEAAAFDWNLAALSVGIKRILDEEARRHGINV
jgi:hypothetical protein